MVKTLPLTEDDRSCGVVEYREEGCYLVFTVNTPQWGTGLKKVWLTSEQGARMLLGTLQPESGRLRLCRKISRSALRCCGMTVPSGAIISSDGASPQRGLLPKGWCSMASFPWDSCPHADWLRREPGQMWQKKGETLLIRYPWRPCGPVPMLPLFRCGCRKGNWWELALNMKP